MHKPELLLDCDGVVCNFLAHALPIIEKVVGVKYTVDMFDEWDIFNHIGKEHEEACWKAINKKGFYRNLPAYDGVTEGIEQIKALAEIHVLTAMSYVHSKHAYFERAVWVSNTLGVSVHDITFSSRKEKIAGDILVDDKPSNIVSWAKAHPNGIGIIWNQPYNKRCPIGPGNIRRAKNWIDVVEAIEDVIMKNDA